MCGPPVVGLHAATTEHLAAFQQLRGYDHWLDYDQAKWHENGAEQAAEIIVWGLVDRPIAISRITDNGCDDLHAGFVTLTGREPLHGFADLCGDSCELGHGAGRAPSRAPRCAG